MRIVPVCYRLRAGEAAISRRRDSDTGKIHPVLSLLFASGKRPDARAIERLISAVPPARSRSDSRPGIAFSLSHSSGPDAEWLELLAQGLSFDCQGIAPKGVPVPTVDKPTAFFGIDRAAVDAAPEAITLMPGPHLAGSEGLLPVVRSLAGLGARLTCLPGVVAVCWEPARSAMAPAYFARIVDAWLGGGAFPALGLTSLERTGNGALCSQGLAFLTGQELIVEAGEGKTAADLARVAIRFAHELVESGPLGSPRDLLGPDGEQLRATPEDRGRLIRLSWR